MILSMDNDFNGMVPCKVLDANGLEWSYVYECDTESGRIERYSQHPETGKPYLNEAGDDPVRETVNAAAPLTIVPIRGDA
jgi:hypothetical protein